MHGVGLRVAQRRGAGTEPLAAALALAATVPSLVSHLFVANSLGTYYFDSLADFQPDIIKLDMALVRGIDIGDEVTLVVSFFTSTLGTTVVTVSVDVWTVGIFIVHAQPQGLVASS